MKTPISASSILPMPGLSTGYSRILPRRAALIASSPGRAPFRTRRQNFHEAKFPACARVAAKRSNLEASYDRTHPAANRTSRLSASHQDDGWTWRNAVHLARVRYRREGRGADDGGDHPAPVPRPLEADRIILPGRCRANLETLSRELGVKVERGPDEISDLPSYFGRGGRAPDLSRYDIRIFSEIVDASDVSIDEILRRAEKNARRRCRCHRSRRFAGHAIPESRRLRPGVESRRT